MVRTLLHAAVHAKFRKLTLLVIILALISFGSTVPVVQAQSQKGRIRVVSMTTDYTSVAVYIDGKAVFPTLAGGLVSFYREVTPGPHTVTFAPEGKKESSAIVPTLKQNVKAGNDYMLTVIGSKKDKTLKGVIVDETKARAEAVVVGDITAAEKAGTVAYEMLFNGMTDVKTLSYSRGGKVAIKSLAFGQYQVIKSSTYVFQAELKINGLAIGVPTEVFTLPSVMAFSALYGTTKAPGVAFANTTERTPTEYLALYQDKTVKLQNKIGTFATAVKAIDAAGMTDDLNTTAGSTIFVPNDAAFNKFGAGAVKQLLSNPEKLKSLLSYHIVPDVLFAQVLAKSRTITTAEGSDITIGIDMRGFSFNDTTHQVPLTGEVRLNNKWIMFVIDSVLTPPSN
jgi:uncharacterized surface protein with fasciclin (FAS1) repeats